MILFIKLLIGHFIGDFILQPDSWVKDKELKKGKSLKLYLHILVHVIVTMIILWDLSHIPLVITVGLVHFIIDLCKLSIQDERNRSAAFAIDQLAHLMAILVIASYHEPFISKMLTSSAKNEIYLMALALITLMPVSSQIIKMLISKWSPSTGDKSSNSLKDAGNYIGILERLFVFSFVITGQVQAVGFLLAAKSVFRFGDLKDPTDRKLTEYILIGTLISFGIAMLIGYCYVLLRTQL